MKKWSSTYNGNIGSLRFVVRIVGFMVLLLLFVTTVLRIFRIEEFNSRVTIDENIIIPLSVTLAVLSLAILLMVCCDSKVRAGVLKGLPIFLGVGLALLISPFFYLSGSNLSSVKSDAQNLASTVLSDRASALREEINSSGNIYLDINAIDGYYSSSAPIKIKQFNLDYNLGTIPQEVELSSSSTKWILKDGNIPSNVPNMNKEAIDGLKKSLNEERKILAYFEESKISGNLAFKIHGIELLAPDSPSCYTIKYRVTYTVSGPGAVMGDQNCLNYRVSNKNEIKLRPPSFGISIDNSIVKNKSQHKEPVNKLEVWVVAGGKAPIWEESSDISSISTSKENYSDGKTTSYNYCLEAHHAGVPNMKYSIYVSHLDSLPQHTKDGISTDTIHQSVKPGPCIES